MGSFRGLLLFVVFVVTPVSALAHPAAPGSSGFLHALASADHFTGFFVIGAMCGLYLHLFRGRLYVYGSLLPFVLLASHDHAPVADQAGLVFALGFLGAGFVIAFAAVRLAMALVEQLGLRPPRTDRD